LKKKRPFLLKLIIFSLAIIAVMGWLRVYQSIYQWETLLRFGVQPGPWYSLISGAVIGVVSTIAALSTWLRFAWSQKYVQISIVILAAGWWLDYLIFSRSSIAFYNLPFRILATSIYLGFVFGYFYLTKKQVAKRMMNEEQQ
jgi:type III secretory pathway component EscS